MNLRAPFQAFPEQSLLGQISKSSRARLHDTWTMSEFSKGQTIMNDEESNSDVCFLLTGAARVALFTQSGREVSFLHLGKGDCFGEFSAIDGAPRSAGIEARATCVAARMTSHQFREVLREAPDLSLALLEILVKKLRDLTTKVSDFNTMNADDRIRAEIVKLAINHANGQDSFTVQNPPTQIEIAARIFSNRETVAREMGRMRHMGLIGRDGRNLKIGSLKALCHYVETKGDPTHGSNIRDLMSA